MQLPKGVHRCHANLRHVAIAANIKFIDLKKSNEYRTSLLYSRKFSSAKNFVKATVRHSSGIYFRQVPVFSRLLFDRSVVALLLIVYLPIHESISYSTLVVIEKNSQEFNLVNKLL